MISNQLLLYPTTVAGLFKRMVAFTVHWIRVVVVVGGFNYCALGPIDWPRPPVGPPCTLAVR
jgi:hypothetical protein